MAYRANEENPNISIPFEKPVFWTVYHKHNRIKVTKVFTKYWFNARILGSIALMISLDDVEAVYENLQ